VSRSEKRKAARGEGGSDMTKFYVILGVVAVIGIGAVGYSIGSNALGSAVSEPIELEGMDDQATLVEMAQGVTKGDADAPVTIVEFGDYQCPGCGGFALSVEPQIDLALVQTGKVKFVYYDFPLTQIHPHAFLAARAARCAQDQDKYWEYHGTLFRNQSTWAAMQNAVGKFIDYSEDVGADRDAFEACLRSDRHADVVSANMRLGYELGVNGTPTIMVNGNGQLRRINNNDFQSIQAAVDQVAQSAETGN
jgi:protein-disulfide isomerase